MTQEELQDHIISNVATLKNISRTEDAVDDAKSIVCPFYRKGKNTGCQFCSQPDDLVLECKETYVSRIHVRPMEVWSPAFDEFEVREKKKISATLSTLKCDTCYLKDNCLEYKAMSTCAIDWADGVDVTDPKQLIDSVIKLQHERIQVSRAAELNDGGIPDQNLSSEMDRMSGLISMKNDMMMDKFSLKIEGQSQNGGDKKGILSQLFGNMGQPQQTQLPVIEDAQTIEIIPITAKVPEFDEKVLEPEILTRRGKKKL